MLLRVVFALLHTTWLLVEMNMVLSLNHLRINLCQQLIVRLASYLMQRLQLLLEQKARRVQVFLDVIEA